MELQHRMSYYTPLYNHHHYQNHLKVGLGFQKNDFGVKKNLSGSRSGIRSRIPEAGSGSRNPDPDLG